VLGIRLISLASNATRPLNMHLLAGKLSVGLQM